jgi:signal transduction histidine kinase
MSELDSDFAGALPDLAPGPYVILAISHAGCGMDNETRDHIFEPFFSTKGEQGTGLGLATVFGIIKKHDGSIWVYTKPDEGTTFTIYLPVSAETTVKEKAKRKKGFSSSKSHLRQNLWPTKSERY